MDNRIRDAVNQAVEVAMERASAATNPNVQRVKKINELKSEVGALRSQLVDVLKALQDVAGGHGGGGRGGGTTSARNGRGASSVSDADAAYCKLGRRRTCLLRKQA